MATSPPQVHGVDPPDVDFINYLNIALMIGSVILAAYLPFETFVLAYVILGPLHYLTEISWLHDRGFYTKRGRDWIWLVCAAGLTGLVTIYPEAFPENLGGAALGFAFTFAAGVTFFRSTAARLFFGSVGVVVGALTISWNPLLVVFAAFLPTLLHVYLFTGLFVLYGACKGRSLSGALSFLVFVVAPFVCVFGFSTPLGYEPTDYFLEGVKPFEGLAVITLDMLGMSVTKGDFVAFFRLLAFAYIYHYLNWFSKTRIINWHQVSRQRLSVIGVAYLFALGVYSINYTWGFLTLMSLSLAHVVLELPLNYRTVSALVGELIPGVVRTKGR